MRLIVGLLVTLFASTLQAEPFTTAPADICQWMQADKFSGGSKYTERGKGLYRCASSRKRINQGEPIGSSVRYVADGSADAVSEVRLEMQMRAFRQPQQALRKFLEYVTSLSSRALNAELPEAVGTSIRSATEGEWSVAGRSVKLERVQDHGSSYDFYFSIR